MKKILSIFLFLFLFTTSVFASSRTINIFTGVPQPSDEGNEKSGGFGDVAANLVAALEIKKRHPEHTVRLLVTSCAQRLDPMVPTSNEIMKVMVPELDATKKGIVQMYGGVEVIYLDVDLGPAIKADFDDNFDDKKFEEAMKNLAEAFAKAVPHSDLNLNFSNYPESANLLRINTKLALGIEEVFESDEMINNAEFGDPSRSPLLELAAGPLAMGFTLTKDVPSSAENIKQIQSWARPRAIALPEDFRPLFAYTSEWQAIQVYIDALSFLKPKGQFALFTKDFPQLDRSQLPSNIQFVAIRAMPFQVMHALIYESALSPLLTGDVSYGQGLSSTNPRKTFIYEAPWWKLFSAKSMRQILQKEVGLGISSRQLSEMFLRTEKLNKLTREQLREKGRKLAKFLANDSLQEKLHRAIQRRLADWDLLENTLGAATLCEKIAGHTAEKSK